MKRATQVMTVLRRTSVSSTVAPTLDEQLANGLVWERLQIAAAQVNTATVGTNVLQATTGANLLPNSEFDNWTGEYPDDVPDNWDLNLAGGASAQDENTHVTQETVSEQTSLRLKTSSTAIGIQAEVLTQFHTYVDSVVVDDWVSGTFNFGGNSVDARVSSAAGTGTKSHRFIAPTTRWLISRNATPLSVRFARVSCQKAGELDIQFSSSGVTYNQAGWLGATHAVALDGAAGMGTIFQRTSINGMAAFTLMMLINPDTLTDGDYLWFKQDEIDVWVNANGSIFARAHYGTTDAETTSSAAALVAEEWQMVTVVLDGDTKQVHIYVNDALVDDSVQAGVGTRVSNTNHLQLWKNASSNAFDGLCDEIYLEAAAHDATWIDATFAAIPP